jgi:hypothetical protein
MDEWTAKQTNTRRTPLYLLIENWQLKVQTQGKEHSRAPTSAPAPFQWPPENAQRKRRFRQLAEKRATSQPGDISTPGYVINFSDDPDATEKLVDTIERQKKRRGVMKRANHFIRKADREGLAGLAFF